ncbi:MAG TPA: hypothetical protein DHD79_08875 [Firmicutes bacterium]|jgi:hypothetical protein|nr:hypothetical protein [Bacillota bacterium]HAW69677.1 hypothetical protein [Bacillota bacterium]HBL50759.1 hypothetical protein [Bacillota bacterium]HBR22975.1 hypothetical protein [Bacillota bacterium]HCF88782.1 hypothetical protein [Bacillota bacterium]
MKQKTPYIVVYFILALAAIYAGYALVQYLAPVAIPVQSRRFGAADQTQGRDAHAVRPAAGGAANDPASVVAGTGNTGIVGTAVDIKGGAVAINRLFFATGVANFEGVQSDTGAPAKPDPSLGPQLQLILTAVFPGKDARAVLMRRGDSPDGESWLVKVGDTVADATVVSIGRDRIVLDAAGTKLTINLE